MMNYVPGYLNGSNLWVNSGPVLHFGDGSMSIMVTGGTGFIGTLHPSTMVAATAINPYATHPRTIDSVLLAHYTPPQLEWHLL